MVQERKIALLVDAENVSHHRRQVLNRSAKI